MTFWKTLSSLFFASALALGVCGDSSSETVDAGPTYDAGCFGGATYCEGTCTSTASDNLNCGECGNACGAGEQCVDSACVLTCPEGLSACGETCVDPLTSRSNCGATTCEDDATDGEVCADGFVCNGAGACELTCQDGLVECGGTCIDPSSSADFCGATTCADDATDGEVCGAGAACLDGACFGVGGECPAGTDEVTRSPSGLAVVCDDPTNTTCEEDFETLCPVNWQLCTQLQLNNRNDGWDFALGGGPAGTVVGEIHCRSGSGAGHYTRASGNLGDDEPLNCFFGSSRDTCVTGFGCNELAAMPVCCAPNPPCGNGVVDAPEEECDDGNLDETDTCLNSCSFRQPSANGVGGC